MSPEKQYVFNEKIKKELEQFEAIAVERSTSSRQEK